MSKLPINLLLYLTSAGLAGGSGWLFYQAMITPAVSSDAITDQVRQSLERGRKQTPDEMRDDYSDAAQPWWTNFRDANLIGFVPKKKVVRTPKAGTKKQPKKAVIVPLDDIIQVVCILYDSQFTESIQVVVRYRPAANVRPPESVARAQQEAYAGPGDARAAVLNQQNRRNKKRGRAPGRPVRPGAAPAMPTFSGESGLVHHLKIGETLWPPFIGIKLERVEPDATAAWFSRPLPGKEKRREDKIFKNELDLDPEVVRQLAESAGAPVRPGGKKGKSASEPDKGSAWVDIPKTKEISPGQWHISREDNQFISSNAEEIFTQDLQLRSYQGKSGTAGVRVHRVSSQLQRFGVQVGDVLLEINGVPVRNKAQALTAGRKQYRQGTRVFRAKVLNRYGRVEERTYYAPNK